MDHLTCPVCGNLLKLKYKLKFNVYKCDSCGLLNSDAQFEHSFQSDLESDSRDIGLRQLRLKNSDTIIKELQRQKGGNLSGLEIGSGNGWWLETCKKNNIDCIGIEPERIYENYHKANNLNIIYGFYPDVSPKKETGYDFIIFNDVFEHIEDINGLVENLKKDLSDNGILIINLPMSTGFFYKMAIKMHKLGFSSSLTRMWQFNFHSPHMNYFNEPNMKLLLTKHGFSATDVLKLETLDFSSVKERIMADKQMNRLKAWFMTTAITLMKPFITSSEPDTKAFFFKKMV
ncbi:class I SAM-dependent methyltransferase [Mucilaginibacter sp. McL0603]|uniref:class I SAM-dependent methyltransferase n=1 Tax=Mucilaginibacter sp. McL0603 TaxID=3415670 RepID=UPI003CE74E70